MAKINLAAAKKLMQKTFGGRSDGISRIAKSAHGENVGGRVVMNKDRAARIDEIRGKIAGAEERAGVMNRFAGEQVITGKEPYRAEKNNPQFKNLDEFELFNLAKDGNLDTSVKASSASTAANRAASKKFKTLDEFHADRVQREHDSMRQTIESGGDGVLSVAKKFGMDTDGVNPADIKKYVHGAVNAGQADAMASKSERFMSGMSYHNVPQKALGGLAFAGVVGSMSKSRGQQTNAQLYGQAPGPGGY